MIKKWIPFLFIINLHASEFQLDLSEALHPAPSEEDIAESIMNGFFQENGHIVRPKVKPILVEHIRRESEEIKIVLAQATISTTPLSESRGDPISNKILNLISKALDETLELEENDKQTRCTRFSTILLATTIGVAGTTLGAVISALVTVNIQNC